MSLAHEYNVMSGLELEACHWLAYRFDDAAGGFRPEEAESWVGSSTGTRLTSSLVHGGWMTGLYQTESSVWVSEATGHVYMNPSLGLSAAWQTFDLDGVLRGVWGLSDDCVFTWGLHAKSPVAYHWNGSEWRKVHSPGHIVGVHGADRDLIVAVGHNGLVARWNGVDGFDAMTSAARGTLSDVHVVSEDEIYACGPDGELVRGTVHGWEAILKHPRSLHCVTAWGEKVWVGGSDGLFTLSAKDTLDAIKPNLQPLRFDSRGDLLITQPTALITSNDGATFTGIALATFSGLAASRAPGWL